MFKLKDGQELRFKLTDVSSKLAEIQCDGSGEDFNEIQERYSNLLTDAVSKGELKHVTPPAAFCPATYSGRDLRDWFHRHFEGDEPGFLSNQHDWPSGERSKVHPCLDAAGDNYASELAIAVRTWEYLQKNLSGYLTPKQQAEKYLKLNFKELSQEAIDRISTVVNWNKRGGVKKQSG